MLTMMQLLNGVSASALLSGGGPVELSDPHWYDVLYSNDFNTDLEANYAGSLIKYVPDSIGCTLGTPAVEGQAVVNGGHINVAHNIDDLGISDFTYEAFIFRNLVDDANPPRFLNTNGLRGYVSGGYLAARLDTDGNDYTAVTSSVAFPLGEWVYVCIERTGNTVRLYQGSLGSGVATMVASGTFEYPVKPGTHSSILSANLDGWFASGKGGAIDCVRVTTVARYSADTDYPIPTVPFPKSDPPEVGLFPKSRKMLHFDASVGVFSDDAGTVPCVDGDPVALWTNQGFMPDAKQTTPANRPIFRTGGQNGMPYIEAKNAIGQFFEDFAYKEPSGLTANSGKTVIMVVDKIDTTIFHGVLGSTASNGGKIAIYFRPTTGEHIHVFNSAWRFSGFQKYPFLIAVNLPTWNTPNVYLNEERQPFIGSNTYPSATVESLEFLRCSGVSGGGAFDGHLYELLFYTGGLSDALYQQMIDYFLDKYDLRQPNKVSAYKVYAVVDETAEPSTSHVTSLKPYTVLREN